MRDVDFLDEFYFKFKRIPDGALHRQNDCRVGQLKLYFENIKQYLRGIK
jgi:hypothetical protein